MDSQSTPASPPTEPTADQVIVKPRERGLGGIDVRPVFHRLNGLVGKNWDDVLGKINGLNGMRYEAKRAAYLRCLGENVATSEDVLPTAPFYVDGNGSLCQRPERRPSATEPNLSRPVEIPPTVNVFLAGRAIGKRGDTLFWFDSIPSKKKVYGGVNPRTGVANYYDQRQTALRQGLALNDEETATFNDFDEKVRADILSRAPAYDPSVS